MRFVFPKALTPGAEISVIAPSSPFPRDEFLVGLAWLRERYRLHLEPTIFAREGFHAGSDERREAELRRALARAGSMAVMAARGGYGVTRFSHRVDWDAWSERPNWLVGFSDVTALHLEAAARGIASIHGPNVTGLGRKIDVAERVALLRALEQPTAEQVWSGLGSLHGGRASGPLVGGNLALVEAVACAGRLQLPRGAVLLLEDVTERPYRIDRMMTSLLVGGHLDEIGGIVLGDFTDCHPGPDGKTALDVLAERTRDLRIPVVYGAPFGHGARNMTIVLGSNAEVCGAEVRFGFTSVSETSG